MALEQTRYLWTLLEDIKLVALRQQSFDFRSISTYLGNRTKDACRTRYGMIKSKTFGKEELDAALAECLSQTSSSKEPSPVSIYSACGSGETSSQGSSEESPLSSVYSKSPIRWHGPLLLPKIRLQDYINSELISTNHSRSFDVVPDSLSPFPTGTTTTLMSYLTSKNPAPSLVRQLNIQVRDSNAKHFWWDIRQIRPWTSFSLSTISSILDLHALLNIPLQSTSFPTPPPSRTSYPETEAELHSIYSTYYITKLNAALAIAQGNRHLVMRPSTAPNQPSFISNYTDDTSELIYGRGFGQVVGLIKSFDSWNSSMRIEGNHMKVKYLYGLAHLHRCMREHNCRYGFIMTEIEIVVVRNGAEHTPHFGYLEVQTIQLAEHDSFAKGEVEVDEEGNVLGMTALLALFYLHMLARDVPLPGQVGWKIEIGAPAEGTRRKCLPNDEWMPEPQLAETRIAKRRRGWVWPKDPVHRMEFTIKERFKR